MKKYIFIILLIPTLVFGQRDFKKGIRLASSAPLDSVAKVVHDTVIYSGSSILDLGTRPSERIEPQTLFTVRFDDGKSDAYTNWLLLLDSLNVVGVAAIHPDSIGKVGFMTWDQVTALQDSGWEILSHGSGNVDWQYINDSLIEDQCSRSKDSLEAHNIIINNIVPPLYSGESLTGREICRKYYRSAGTGYTVGIRHNFNYPAIDQFNICAMRGDLSSNFLATQDDGIDSVKNAIDQAILDKTWGVYFLHGYSIDKAIGLRKIIEYCQDSSISIVTINQALDYFEPYLTSGREFNVNERGMRIGRVYGDGMIISQSLTSLGLYAAYGSEGTTQNVSIGAYSNEDGNGAWRTDIGHLSGRFGHGDHVVNIGKEAGYNSSVDNMVNIGNQAGYEAVGIRTVFGGYYSGYQNTGHYASGWGYESARGNSGLFGLFLGRESGEDNSGDHVMGIGDRALQNNTTDYIFEIKQTEANSSPLLRGFFDDRSFISGAPASAVGDAEIPNSSVHFYLDEGTDKLMIRVRYSDGSYATGEFSLTPDP